MIDRLYHSSGRARYRQFQQSWSVGKPPRQGLSSPPSQPTFSHLWKGYGKKWGLRVIEGETLTHWLADQFAKGLLDLDTPPEEQLRRTSRLLAAEGYLFPAMYRLRRAVGHARREIRQRDSQLRLHHLQQSLGVSMADLPLTRRWVAARELLRLPPAALGKANLSKMETEHQNFQDLSGMLASSGLDPGTLLRHPDALERFIFVERHPPSVLAKWEKTKVMEALPFYLARRHQGAIDAVLTCFLRLAGVVRKRSQEDLEQSKRDESLALLERTGPRLRAMKTALATAFYRGNSSYLRPFQHFFARFESAGASIVDKQRLYRIIASKGFYTRKLAYRLVGLEFVGHDHHSRSLLKALKEVLRDRNETSAAGSTTPTRGQTPKSDAVDPLRAPRLASFKEAVPYGLARELSFLEVPRHLLTNRRVFEPMVLLTLAEYLNSGRVTVVHSHRYGDLTTGLDTRMTKGETQRWLNHRQQNFEREWEAFKTKAGATTLVHDGRLKLHRPPKLLLSWEEKGREEAHRQVVRNLESVSILEVLLRVHRMTGFLHEFRLPRPAPHQLAEGERLRFLVGILACLGMNTGTKETASVLGLSEGRVQHLITTYLTKENLVRALQRVQTSWEERGLGKTWGPGDKISVDGKVVGAFESNLLSRYHCRRGRSGMTVFWCRRDDGIATRVMTLGNQEWESWHVLGELLFPLVGKLRESCGDTQAQFLGLWGLAELVGRRITARFRRASQVLLYTPDRKGRAGLKRLQPINWKVLEENLPCMMELAERVRKGLIPAVEVLRRWHIYDAHGHDLAEGFRELGRVSRTEFLLRYDTDVWLQRRCQKMCNDAENWNSFHSAVFCGNGGKLQTNDPRRQEETLLALTILLDSIVYDNVSTYGAELKASKAPTPVLWDHIVLQERYKFKRVWFEGVGRPDL